MSALPLPDIETPAPDTALVLVPDSAPVGGKDKRTPTGAEYVRAVYWAGAAGSISWLAALPFAAPSALPMIMLAGTVLGFLGYLDHVTRRVLDIHNAAFAALTVLLLGGIQVAFVVPVLLHGFTGAVAAFAFMFLLAWCGVGIGGGDLKLSAIAGATAGVFSPIIGPLVWVALTFILHSVWLVGRSLSKKDPAPVAGVPFMAAAFIGTIVLLGLTGAAAV